MVVGIYYSWPDLAAACFCETLTMETAAPLGGPTHQTLRHTKLRCVIDLTCALVRTYSNG